MRTKSVKKTTEKKPAAAKPAAEAKCKVTAKKTAKKTVVFTVHAEKGKTVCLAGDFNNWSPTAKKMAYKARAGVYTASVKLAPGTYQYKFVIDGAWCADPENVNAVPNDQGTFNSIVTFK
ncbi:MAG: glycogen-binding domain-containing protein [Kiritimatiellae bacterium]|nr:glycogen-binding domain-containing protein [Kiritimatiellia bacterium]